MSHYICRCCAIVIYVVWVSSASNCTRFYFIVSRHLEVGLYSHLTFSLMFSHFRYSFAIWKMEWWHSSILWGKSLSRSPKSCTIGGTCFLFCFIKCYNEIQQRSPWQFFSLNLQLVCCQERLPRAIQNSTLGPRHPSRLSFLWSLRHSGKIWSFSAIRRQIAWFLACQQVCVSHEIIEQGIDWVPVCLPRADSIALFLNVQCYDK